MFLIWFHVAEVNYNIMVKMKKAGKRKKQDKCLKQVYSGDHCDMLIDVWSWY